MEYKILVTVNAEEVETSEGKSRTLFFNVKEEEGAIDIDWREKCHSLIIAAETIAKNNNGSILDILPVVTDFLQNERKEK